MLDAVFIRPLIDISMQESRNKAADSNEYTMFKSNNDLCNHGELMRTENCLELVHTIFEV